MPTIYLALGTNQGDRVQNLRRALELLAPFAELARLSSIYETAPWGIVDQPDFLNMAAQGTTNLPPLELLDELKRIEHSMGRLPTIRYGPREIDLDILLYGEMVVQTERLEIPHPRMAERGFVLIPLREIAPDLAPPGFDRTIRQLAEVLPDTRDIRKYREPFTLTDVTTNS